VGEGSWVGLDVHARSVVAGVIDQRSGEVRSLRVPAGSGETVAWLQTLPPPVRVVYEAGPTGYRLARACAAGAMPSGWRGCFGWARSPRCGCPSRKRRPRVISCVLVRTRVAI
jgi:hypothetical protein